MRLKNKKTGEIERACPIYVQNCGEFNSLAELNEEWEDYEEQKDYYFIGVCGEVVITDRDPYDELAKQMQSIGNYFETKEEAEKAVEELKAWKRLKDAGFIVNSWNGNLGGGDHYNCCGQVNITAEVGDRDKRDTVKADLDLLFSDGGE